MAILDMLNKSMFASRFKLRVYIATCVFAVAVIGLSAPSFIMKNQPRNARVYFALITGIASIILTTYQVSIDHIKSLKQYHNHKANVILGVIESTLWGIVGMIIMQANIKKCDGSACTRSWIIAVLGLIANHTVLYSTAISFREFREHRENKKTQNSTLLNSTAQSTTS